MKWEYLVKSINWQASDTEREGLLDERGEDEWELVSETTIGDRTRYTFKRAKGDGGEEEPA